MLLLDSQALLWLLDDNPRLGPRAREAITTAQGVYVSAATVWELTIKTMLGKLSIRDFPELVSHDPFDRLLVAQAFRAGLGLLTADQILLSLDRDFIIDAGQ